MSAQPYAEQARAQKSADAAALGIDDALISTLVETFYARIRDDAMLAPIFAAKVKDWPHHLARMKDFWASIALESGRYSGNPMLKHMAVPDLGPAHFTLWLTLWEATLDDVAQPRAAALFRDRAARIATSLQTGIAIHNGGLAAIARKDV